MVKVSNFRTGALFFLLPAAVLFSSYFLFPIAYVLTVSLLKWDGVSTPEFVGIRNFINLFRDEVFIISIRNNLIWAASEGVIQVSLAVFVALLLDKKPKGWKLFRTVYFFPHVISGVAIAMLWGAIYNNQYGILNGFLRMAGLSGLQRNWLGNLDTALPAVLIYGLFYIGYFMVIILAEISAIPKSYYEAASIDGASPFMSDWYITLPLIRGAIATCVTLGMVYGLRQFEQVFLLTNGGPANSTSVMVLYLYKQLQSFSYGSANAAAAVLMGLGVVVIVSVRKLFHAAKYEM